MIRIPPLIPVRIRKLTKVEIVALGWLVLLGFAFVFGRKSLHFLPEAPLPLETMEKKLGEAKLPEIEISIPEGSGPESESQNEAKIKVLNANLIGLYDSAQAATSTDSGQQSPKLSGIRILGEVQSVGQKSVSAAKPIIRFYSADKKILATKVANFNEGYQWLTLAPNEINAYDLLIPNPPPAEIITIEMRAVTAENKFSFLDGLKIKNKNLESASLKRGENELAYFKFTSLLLNSGEEEIASPGISVWLKNDQGEVIGLASKILSNDILSSGKEVEINLLVTPADAGMMFSYEVKTFGEKI